jgi:hypothetical protein
VTALSGQAEFALRFQRGPKSRQQARREPGAIVERGETAAAEIADKTEDAPRRHARQFTERGFEQHRVAAEQRAQDQAGGELSRLTQIGGEFACSGMIAIARTLGRDHSRALRG